MRRVPIALIAAALLGAAPAASVRGVARAQEAPQNEARQYVVGVSGMT